MYQPAIVTFLDILGFGHLVSNSSPDIINTKLDAIEKFTRPIIPFEADELLRKVIQFSDSVIRVVPIESELNRRHPVGLLFSELLNLVHAQIDLIKEGILIRGGMAFGDVFITGNRIFGPAVISAYDLESNYALYPRIIVSPDLLQEYKHNPLLKAAHHTIEMDVEYTKNLLRQGEDGILFVDYGRAVESEFDEIEMYPVFLKHHKDLIVTKGNELRSLSRAMSKYLWLANYHNQIVLELNDNWFIEYNLEKSDLLISSEELKSLQYI